MIIINSFNNKTNRQVMVNGESMNFYIFRSNNPGQSIANIFSLEPQEIKKKLYEQQKTPFINYVESITHEDILYFYQQSENIDELTIVSDTLFIKSFFDSFIDTNNVTLDAFIFFLRTFQIKIPDYYLGSPADKPECYGESYGSGGFITIDFYDAFLSEIDLIKDDYCVRQKNRCESDSCVSYICNSFLDLLISETHFVLSNGYTFKQCKNCGKYFVPYNRSDTLYCDRKAPQDKTKTCKEYGAIKAYQDNLKNNESMGLYRNTYMRLQMMSKRNPDIKRYKDNFEEYKRASKQWKAEIKQGTKTESEFVEWLKSLKER